MQKKGSNNSNEAIKFYQLSFNLGIAYEIKLKNDIALTPKLGFNMVHYEEGLIEEDKTITQIDGVTGMTLGLDFQKYFNEKYALVASYQYDFNQKLLHNYTTNLGGSYILLSFRYYFSMK